VRRRIAVKTNRSMINANPHGVDVGMLIGGGGGAGLTVSEPDTTRSTLGGPLVNCRYISTLYVPAASGTKSSVTVTLGKLQISPITPLVKPITCTRIVLPVTTIVRS